MSVATLKAESKKTVRRPVGKVRITWTDPLIDLSLQYDVTEENRVNYIFQTADLVNDVPQKWIHTNNPNVLLDGNFYPMPGSDSDAVKTQVGWWGSQSCDALGGFAIDPSLTIRFTPRLVVGITVSGDSAYGEYPVDFTVRVKRLVGSSYVTVEVMDVTDNDQVVYSSLFENEHNSAGEIELTIHKWSQPGSLIKISEFYSSIVEEFNRDEILYMNLLEEFESSDGTLPVGNISCNELDLKLQNLTDRFFVGNTESNIHTFIKPNRKIEPFFGFEYSDGSKEYIQKGLYWSGDWSVSDLDTGAQTSARDRMELLRKEDIDYEIVFPNILYNKSSKEILLIILESAKSYMPDFFYDASDLDDGYNIDIILPEFFKGKSYFDAVKELTASNIAYAYMDIPTLTEVTENGVLCKDIMRIKKFSSVFPINGDYSEAEDIEKKDYIEKNQPAKTEELANIVTVNYKIFTQDPDDEDKWEDENIAVTSQDSDSISTYGRLKYEYPENNFIQNLTHARSIADILLSSYKLARKDVELQCFGDITLKLADILNIPEYQKRDIEKRGIFSITKMNTQYDGSLRMSISARKLDDAEPEEEYFVVQDTDGAITKWQDNDSSTAFYQDDGV